MLCLWTVYLRFHAVSFPVSNVEQIQVDLCILQHMYVADTEKKTSKLELWFLLQTGPFYTFIGWYDKNMILGWFFINAKYV